MPAVSNARDDMQAETESDECQWNGSGFALCTDLLDHEDHPDRYKQYRYQSFHFEPSMERERSAVLAVLCCTAA